MKQKLLLLFIFVTSLKAELSIWPKPNIIVEGNKTIQITECSINFQKINFQKIHVQQKFNQYFKLIFSTEYQFLNCNSENQIIDFSIDIIDDELKPSTLETSEKYILKIDEQQIILNSDTYVGYLRGLETLSQLLIQRNGIFILENIPLNILDEPYLQYRGIMIDTARHFLKVSTIIKTLDAMSFAKLNVLHIHFTDDESFPLFLETYPNITITGAYSKSEIYSREDIQKIVDYATLNGVRIIPEVDSPGHARSWGLSDKFSPMMILCPGAENYNGQLDPTMDLTYQANAGIFQDVQRFFPDQFVHFGGDEVIYSCWDKRPSIKQWMIEHNISDYIQMQIYYRNKQRELLKNKTSIFWTNEKLHIPPSKDDVLQYWGPYDQVSLLKDLTNKVILSPDDYYYINTGLGFIWGNNFGTYTKWDHIYSMDPVPKGFAKERILGGEVTLWGEVSGDGTADNYLWPRAAAMAGRLWTEKKSGQLDVVKSLVNLENLFVKRGIKSSPVTKQYCAVHPEKCYNNI